MTLEQRLKLTKGFQKALFEYVVAESVNADKQFTNKYFQTVFTRRVDGSDGEFINSSVHCNFDGEHKNYRLDKEMERIPEVDTCEAWKDVAPCVKSVSFRYWLTREEKAVYDKLKAINADVAFCVLTGNAVATQQAIKDLKLNAEQTKSANALIAEIRKIRENRDAKGVSAKKETVFIEWVNEDKLPFKLESQVALQEKVDSANEDKGITRSSDFGGGFVDVEIPDDYSAMFA